MKAIYCVIPAVCLILSGCGSIKVISDPKALEDCYSDNCSQCEKCKIIPKSGNFKDRRVGYYFDPIEKKCKQIVYSSGDIPAPFDTMEECTSCCCCVRDSNNKNTDQ